MTNSFQGLFCDQSLIENILTPNKASFYRSGTLYNARKYFPLTLRDTIYTCHHPLNSYTFNYLKTIFKKRQNISSTLEIKKIKIQLLVLEVLNVLGTKWIFWCFPAFRSSSDILTVNNLGVFIILNYGIFICQNLTKIS